MSTLIQPPPPSYRKWWWVPAAVVVAALVVGAALWVPTLVRPDDSCGTGVVHSGPHDECAGVTDGSYVFATELAEIEGRILAENRAVENSGEPYVSVVTMSPMTAGRSAESIVTMAGIRHRLEGAHLAQLAENRTAATPKIKLLLANPGSDFAEWETAVGKIQERREDDRIVAVTGIAFSIRNAVRAVERLSELQLPVIGSTLTADDLPVVRGFYRVSPTAAGHARAAAEYLATGADRIMVIRDDNPADHYGTALDAAFRARFAAQPQRIVSRVESYDSEVGNVATAFRGMLANICRNNPDTIYFAGRAAHALGFLTELAGRNCPEIPIQVVTGDDMAYYNLADSPARIALDTGVSVLYTGLVHEEAWRRHPDLFNRVAVARFTDECTGEVCYRELSGDALDDFAAVMDHDAVLTAVRAIRQAADFAGTVVTPGQVIQAMKGLHGATQVSGASGMLSFDEDGLPTDKPILILKAHAGERPEYVGLSVTSSG
ncbi:ABC transporter substrate-binding protein [Nocardia carnea]|uniref:ABC transporter substrate-binding protein n=1 Tax=Nocardia carnea TaxID=37328 RepID=UPI002454DA8A|nr:ABC transporter substrate-binding protein [Nocardia carnea]